MNAIKLEIRRLKETSNLERLRTGDIIEGSLEGKTEKLLVWKIDSEPVFIVRKGNTKDNFICLYGLRQNKFIAKDGIVSTERYSTIRYRIINKEIPEYSKSSQRDEEYQELNRILKEAGL